MNKTLLFLCISFSSLPLFAQDFCARTQNDIKTHLLLSESRIAFKNAGGLFNGGVCWWHNRLQRSSAYLVRFEPRKPKPSRPELMKILATLRLMNEVVVIPGFSDFVTFSKTYHFDVQSMLNEWQKIDGLLNFEWLRGISGQASLNPLAMKARMFDVYDYYKTSPTPLWVMAQIRGITSHGFLIVDMEQTPKGFMMEVIDSNHPLETYTVEYQEGDRFLRPRDEKYTFVPYVGFQNDYKLLAGALKKECKNKSVLINFENIREGQIE